MASLPRILAGIILISAVLSWEYVLGFKTAGEMPTHHYVALIASGPVAWGLAAVGALLLIFEKDFGAGFIILSAIFLVLGAFMFNTTFSFVPFLNQMLPPTLYSSRIAAFINLVFVFLLIPMTLQRR